MTSRIVRLLPVLTALLLLGEGRARAEMIDFSYSWTVQPSSVIPGGTGSVTLAAAADGTGQATLGSMTPVPVPGATVTTSSSAIDVPDSFSSMFSMKLHLTDTASGQSGDLVYAGALNGTLTATSSNLTASFNGPLMQTLQLGNNLYSVTIGPESLALPVPGSAAPALIDGLLTAAAA